MNRLIYALLFLITATPSFAATAKMKNEPKVFAGMQCGDTPFKKFSPDHYVGREKKLSCARIYQKNGVDYFFNNKGQLYAARVEGKEGDYRAFKNTYGVPTSDTKNGSEYVQNRSVEWTGNNLDISILISEARSDKQPKYSTFYFCKKIDAPDGCDSDKENNQIKKVDEFVKLLEFDFSLKIPEFPERDENYQKKVKSLSENVEALGLPKTELIRFLKQEDGIFAFALLYPSKDLGKVRNILFSLIGDMPSDLKSTFLAGDKYTVMIIKDFPVEPGVPSLFGVSISLNE